MPFVYVLKVESEHSLNMSLRRLSMSTKARPFRVVILGQNGVGKSALTVRFVTHRFIGDYDPLLENTYSCTKCFDGDTVSMEILDTAAQEENNRLEANIKWADAYIVVYAVTDRCSFNECSRLKVLINSYSKRIKTNGQTSVIPAVLVGNQIDRCYDRMVNTDEGREKANEMNFIGFYEISVREDRDCAFKIFSDIYRHCRKPGTRQMELRERLSCPPSLEHDRNLRTADSTSRPLHRRRRALYTIS